jgi:hypothetical protein
MKQGTIRFITVFLLITIIFYIGCYKKVRIPLSEHPRPDFKRLQWENLNGEWKFQFDFDDSGIGEEWYRGEVAFSDSIKVPFPWGSALSGVEDKADIAWYSRKIQVPESWRGGRIFLIIGACDWYTTAWLDGKMIGEHKGGYVPFEFEITTHVEYGNEQNLVIRVDDTPHPFKLEGKQGYGPARGIWQTPYLEARGDIPLDYVHFTPDIDREKVMVEAKLIESAPKDLNFELDFINEGPKSPVTRTIPKGEDFINFEVPIPDPHLWSLEDPFLYEVKATVNGDNVNKDEVSSYFGMRKISIMDLSGTDYSYVALNNEPVYLQMALDQAYHPEGYYTFPSDEFMKNEIKRVLRLGINGIRIHVKIGIPRKIYWADRLGVLIMEDVPNSWGEPTEKMKEETERALRGMIKRDYNHPSIFSWVLFNETWGLRSKKGDRMVYTDETKDWVIYMYHLAKSLDITRLVEDNSANRRDHLLTDINSWHSYLPGYRWNEVLDRITEESYPGSGWNFAEGYKQGNEPLLNSEFGNVWGYEGSTGDVDWSWDYHLALNEFRSHPEVCGWLYTEFHDVINEWNGYYRYDRSNKITGLSELTEGMTLNDLHSKFYIAPEGELCRKIKPDERIELPLWASFLTDSFKEGKELTLRIKLHGWNSLGKEEVYSQSEKSIIFKPWMSEPIPPVEVSMPDKECLAVLSLFLEDGSGKVLHRNFTTFLVTEDSSYRDKVEEYEGQKVRFISFSPSKFEDTKWSRKQWNVMDSLKVNGVGYGFFEYRIPWPEGLTMEDIQSAGLYFELSAKKLFSKDTLSPDKIHGDFMLGRGTQDPSLNPNSYPMTDSTRYPSNVNVFVNGVLVGTQVLKDDPADHRGILSWYSQKRDRRLREAGSYGELVEFDISENILSDCMDKGEIIIRLEVEESVNHGLAIYGKRFGRYPLDPTILFMLKE